MGSVRGNQGNLALGKKKLEWNKAVRKPPSVLVHCAQPKHSGPTEMAPCRLTTDMRGDLWASSCVKLGEGPFRGFENEGATGCCSTPSRGPSSSSSPRAREPLVCFLPHWFPPALWWPGPSLPDVPRRRASLFVQEHLPQGSAAQ